MARGRKITLHLVDGTANGVIKGQLGNWVGLVTFGKVTQLTDLAADTEIKRPGVYILSGPDPDERNPESVYIGESENIWQRLKQHDQDDNKAHFEKVAIVTSRDESLTKGHIRYLESKLIHKAYAGRRASVLNGTAPEVPPLPAADRDEMDVFIDHLELLLPVLGMNFILPAPDQARDSKVTQPVSAVESPEFSLVTKEQETGTQVEARAQVINGEFVVLVGSTALKRIEGGYASKKEQLIKDAVLVDDGDHYRFTTDAPFNSPSAAAAIIRGQNTNGVTYWKLPTGMTYRDWQDTQIAERERS